MSMIERLKKRRCYPVPIGEDKVYCRALTIGELKTIDTLSTELGLAFAIGCALVDDAGQPAIARQPTETHEAFAKRALECLTDVTADSLNAIQQAIKKLNDAPPPIDDLKKN
jgi:hypothetical protein